MAKILKCPRCQQVMDVTSVSPGSTVRCPDCGQMAAVPTGVTSVAVKTVSAPMPPSAPPSARDRGTRIRNNRSSGTLPLPAPPTSSHGGLLLGLGIGAVAVAGIIVGLSLKGKQDEPPPAPPPVVQRGAVTFKPTLPPSSDKPLRLGESRNEDAKPTVIAKPAENANSVNWDQLMNQLRPGGGFEFPDRPEGIAFLKVKAFGKASYPHLIKYIDDDDQMIARAAVAVLNNLTGRESPLPRGANKSKIKAEWQAWLEQGDSAKPEAPK